MRINRKKIIIALAGIILLGGIGYVASNNNWFGGLREGKIFNSAENQTGEIKLISDKKDFKSDEEPELKFHYEKKQGIVSAAAEALGIFGSEVKIKTTGKIINPRGESEDVLSEEIVESKGDISIKLKKESGFKPGLYKISLAVREIDEEGNISPEETLIEQEFTWGVLAILILPQNSLVFQR